MPLINPAQIKIGNKIEVGNISFLMAIVGPIVQTKEKNYLPHIYTCYHNGHERVERWTYREGPAHAAEIVTNTRNKQKTFWFGWR
jgi:hypothetical protein